MFAGGLYNDPNSIFKNDSYIFTVGNGSSSSNRSNAFAITESGKIIANEFIKLDGNPIIITGTYTGTAISTDDTTWTQTIDLGFTPNWVIVQTRDRNTAHSTAPVDPAVLALNG